MAMKVRTWAGLDVHAAKVVARSRRRVWGDDGAAEAGDTSSLAAFCAAARARSGGV